MRVWRPRTAGSLLAVGNGVEALRPGLGTWGARCLPLATDRVPEAGLARLSVARCGPRWAGHAPCALPVVS